MGMEVIFKSNLVAVKKAIRQQLRKNMWDATEYLKDKIQKKLSKIEGGGRIYFNLSKYDEKGRLVFKYVHKASAPGEPPVKFTGKLIRSIKNDVVESPYYLEGKVYSEDKKAHYLEFGTYKMAKRPFFKSTFEENKLKIIEILYRNTEGYNKKITIID